MTRLKNIDEVFHYWANAVQRDGECGNVSFVNGDLFSYARCIATIHRRGSKTLVLFDTSGRDSATTGRHIYKARRAAAHLTCIAVPDGKPGESEQHEANLEAIATAAAQASLKAGRARAAHVREHLLTAALDGMQEYNAYAEFFGLKARLADSSIADLAAQVAAQQKAAAKEKAEEQKALDAKLQVNLAAWRDGLSVGGLWRLSFVALRLKDGMIETSKGASIPVPEAHTLWPIIRRCRRGDMCFEPGQPVGVYRLTKIREDGSLVVGCHDIPYTEIEAIAQQLGLIKPPVPV